MIDELATGNCVPCKGTSPLSRTEVERILRELPGWTLIDDSISKEFRFGSYMNGLEFAHDIGKTAERQDHHPDILVRWRRVKLVFSTHVIKGLSMNDFIMAARAELEYRKHSSR